ASDERAELEVVRAALAGLELDQLASLPRVEAAGDPVRTRLDAHDVGALAEHPPDEVMRELNGAEYLVRAEAESVVDDRDRGARAGTHRRVARRGAGARVARRRRRPAAPPRRHRARTRRPPTARRSQ